MILVACVLIYAARVKRNPTLSPMYRADEYWRNRRTESGEEVAYTIPVASYVVYGLIVVSLIIFAVVYPVTTFSLGNASVTFYAVPVGTVLFALFGWLGLRKSFHFFILSSAPVKTDIRSEMHGPFCGSSFFCRKSAKRPQSYVFLR